MGPNSPESVNSTLHTSHFLALACAHFNVTSTLAQVWRAQRTFHVIACVIFMRSCCVFDSPRLSLPLLAVYLFSFRLVHPPGSQLLLPRCGGQISCTLLLMRTLAPLPSRTISQKLFDTFEHFLVMLEDNTLILPRTVAEGLHQVHQQCWKFTRFTLHNSFWMFKKARHAVFITVVNPMFVDQHVPVEHDLTTPRIALHKNGWKVHQNTEYWCNLRIARSKGLQNFIKPDPRQSCCRTLFARGVYRKSGKHKSQEKNFTIILVVLQGYRQKLYSGRICIMLDRILLFLNRENPVTNTADSTGKPVTTKSDSMQKPIAVPLTSELQRLPHSVALQEDTTRRETVKDLIHRFETHPNREALKAGLEKNQIFSPFGEESKEMIRSMGNSEIKPKVKFNYCMKYWNKGIRIIVHAEHKTFGQKVANWTRTGLMFCQYLIMRYRKDHLAEHDTDQQ